MRRQIIRCPRCGLVHVDRGEWAERPHRTHLCEGCGSTWRPSRDQTVGVACLVTNLRRGDDHDVYVGRPSKWGNPFVVKVDGGRATVVRLYRTYLRSRPDLVEDARRELVGKRLGCWCAPLACHADVLAEVAAGEDP